MRALVVRTSSIGDVVHVLPALRALHRAGHEVGWLVEPASRVLLDANPLVSRVVTIPAVKAFRVSDAGAAVSALRARASTWPWISRDSGSLQPGRGVSGARRVIGYAGPWRRERASSLLLDEKVSLPAEAVHVIDKNLALLRALGIDAIGLREFPLPPAPDAGPRVEAGLAGLGLREFAVLNPGGGWASKLWPAESFGELARGLRAHGLASIVTWGPGEEDLAGRVVAASGGAAMRSFPTSLLDYVELARRARVVVAGDTGTLHLACAVRTPVVALFGPTDPARNGPFDPADVVLRRAPPCAPCHRRVCPRHDGIMAGIPVGEALTAVERRLALPAGRRLAV